jgi:hypothetical protein
VSAAKEPPLANKQQGAGRMTSSLEQRKDSVRRSNAVVNGDGDGSTAAPASSTGEITVDDPTDPVAILEKLGLLQCVDSLLRVLLRPFWSASFAAPSASFAAPFLVCWFCCTFC